VDAELPENTSQITPTENPPRHTDPTPSTEPTLEAFDDD